MAERRIHTVHDRDLESLLKSLTLLEPLRNGKMKCAECECDVTEENFGCIYPFEGEIRFCCDNPECIYKVMQKIKQQKESSGEGNGN